MTDYSFEAQYIAGEWRPGSSDQRIQDKTRTMEIFSRNFRQQIFPM